MRLVQWIREARHDVRFAVRQLRRAPGFALIATLTLALGIGATTAIFSVVYAVVLRPFAFPQPDQVMVLSEVWGAAPSSVSVGNFHGWRTHTRAFATLAAEYSSSFNLTDDAQPERLIGSRATSTWFDVFAVAPLLGRTFTVDEDRPGATPVVVLSHRLWTRRFGSDRGIVGRPLRLSGQTYQVVGVMPAALDFSANGPELWVPAAFTPKQIAQHDEHFLNVYGRLAPGVTGADALTEMRLIHERMKQEFPGDEQVRAADVRGFGDTFIGDNRRRLLVLLGAVSLVLLIACSNVAHLLLARGGARARELAMRVALGAGRARIVRQLLTETLVTALAGAVSGVLIAYLAVPALVAASPAGIPRLEQTRVDTVVLGFALAAAIVSAFLAGLSPALRAGRTDVRGVLNSGGRGGSASRDRLRTLLVAGEVALALMLLIGAGLLVRSAMHLQHIPPGFDPAGVLTSRLSLPAAEYQDPERVVLAFDALASAAAASPLVEAAAVSSSVPLTPGGNGNGLLPEGKAVSVSNFVSAQLAIISPAYFDTLRIPLRAGRLFSVDDRRDGLRVMVVNETAAQLLFPGENPLGKRVSCCEGTPTQPHWKTIVGVVADVRSLGPARAARAEFFLPLAQAPDAAWTWLGRTMTLVLRGRPGAEIDLTPVARAAAQRSVPSVPLFQMQTMANRMRTSLSQARFNTMLMLLLGGIGLTLAAIGVAGVIAYAVAERRREIGIRVALGARNRSVVGLMARQALAPILAGLAIGTGGALALSQVLAASVHGVTTTDAPTYAIAAVTVAAVAALAVLIPARRAARLDPVRALAS